jgi:hypothetical protein
MSNLKRLMVTAAVAAASLGQAVGPASAGPFTQISPLAPSHGSPIQQVGWGWGWGPGIGLGILGGAIIGGAIARPYYADPYYGRPYYYRPYYAYPRPYYYRAPTYYAPPPPPAYGAVDYCLSRFRSYDPRTGTYLGYDGYRHPCP